MEQAGGFDVPSRCEEKLVYKLNNSLYGLKQSGKNLNGGLHRYLLENDCVQSGTDHCVYTKQVESETIVLLVWVDDLIIGASNETLLCNVKKMLNDKCQSFYNQRELPPSWQVRLSQNVP